MLQNKVRLLGLWIALLCAPTGLYAKTFGGQPSLLTPSHPKSKIEVRSVTSTLQLKSSRGPWRVETTYQVRSRATRGSSPTLAAMEPGCDLESQTCRDASAGKFMNHRVTVNGVELKPKAEPARPGQDEWMSPKGRTLHYAIPFSKKGWTTVVQSYETGVTTDPEGLVLDLFVGSKGYWRGPVGHLTLKIELPSRPWTVGHPSVLKRESYLTVAGAKASHSVTKLTFKKKKLRPDGVMRFHFGTALEVGDAKRCPDMNSVVNAVKSGSKGLDKLLVMRSPDELRRCRKVYLALFGFPFNAKADKTAFYGKPVASASPKNTVMSGNRVYVRFGLQPNRGYDRALHPQDHLQYMEGLAAELKRRDEPL